MSSNFLVTEWLLVTFLVYSQVPPRVCRSDFCEFEYLRYEFTHTILFKKLMEMENGIKFLKREIWQYFYRFLSINLLENWRFRKPVERVIGLGAAGL